MNIAKRLETYGYAVVPCLVEEARSGKLKEQMRSALSEMPEFVDPKNMVLTGERFVQGGFAALGNPSSFHHTFVRKIRKKAYDVMVREVFTDFLAADPGLKLEQVIDRLMFRRASQKPSRESWHRDESSDALPNDEIFGGWINLDEYEHYFSGCPGTHTEVKSNRGFARIKDPKPYIAKKQLIRIPPGHVFIFNERMVHEVVRVSGTKDDQHRLFLGWRLTYADQPLFRDVVDRMLVMAPMQIKSGQEANIYPQLYWTNWRDRLVDWSRRNVKKEFREFRTLKKTGEVFLVAQQNMNPLGPGFECCPQYLDEEIFMHLPHRPSIRGNKKRKV
jgi:hypothetical protein